MKGIWKKTRKHRRGEGARDRFERALARATSAPAQAIKRAGKNDSGQGTTEYAILVGVLVVIAILAVALFRDRIQELWDSIANGINSL